MHRAPRRCLQSLHSAAASAAHQSSSSGIAGIAQPALASRLAQQQGETSHSPSSFLSAPWTPPSLSSPRAFSSPRHTTGDMPAGHLHSDLTRQTCHIGLNRLRDLTLRQDLCLWEGKQKRSLRELFKGKRVIVVGFPGGKICTEQHIPSYVKLSNELEQRGIHKVFCVTPSTPDELEGLRAREDLRSPKVDLLADGNGGFVRMMGFELGIAEVSGPKCQRFAGIVDDGVLLKVRVETTPIELKTTDCRSMLELFDSIVQAKKS